MLKLNTKSSQMLKQFTRLYQKAYPQEVTLVEVGPRDGLQNEKVCNPFFISMFT
jgi:hypothetical protein